MDGMELTALTFCWAIFCWTIYGIFACRYDSIKWAHIPDEDDNGDDSE